ncbi:MAG: hypothetical protein RIF32_06810 [Leptospirales bacterium]|jgi:hypothetical protein
MKKILTTIALIAVILGGVWFSANWHHVSAFPSIISSWYSKEFCSCHFVVGRDEDFCHNIARQWVSISDFQLDSEAKTVTVTGLGRANTARYLGPRQGCVLENQ